MSENRTQQARRLFNSPFVPAAINEANRRKWIAAVQRLGPLWKLAHVMPIPEAAKPTLGQLRERLKVLRASPQGAMPYSESETIADRMERRIREREIVAGLREDACGALIGGAA